MTFLAFGKSARKVERSRAWMADVQTFYYLCMKKIVLLAHLSTLAIEIYNTARDTLPLESIMEFYKNKFVS